MGVFNILYKKNLSISSPRTWLVFYNYDNFEAKSFNSFTLFLLDLESFGAFIRCNLLFLIFVSMETTQLTNLFLKNVSYSCFPKDSGDMIELIAEGGQLVPLTKL